MLDGNDAALERREFAVEGGALSARVRPRDGAPRILFSHANGFNARTYDRVLAPLAERYEIVALDLRGCGLSTAQGEPATLRDWTLFAADIGAVAAALSDRPLIIAGHSYGATSSILFAAGADAEHPVVAVEPVLMPPLVYGLSRTPYARVLRNRNPLYRAAMKRRPRFDSREAVRASYASKPLFASWAEGVLDDYLADGLIEEEGGVRLACDPRWEAAIFAAHGHRPWRAVRRLGPRLRILAGGRGSTVMSREGVARAGAHLETTEEGGHLLPMEAPQRVSAWLRAEAERAFA
ncbi:MAG: alpha/beta hydrolase [Pseudomonadota bacterium]